MMAMRSRRSVRPILEMSSPSISMLPDVNSTMRKRAIMMDDFPAPVLSESGVSHTRECETGPTHRPTTPIFSPAPILKSSPFKTGGRPCR